MTDMTAVMWNKSAMMTDISALMIVISLSHVLHHRTDVAIERSAVGTETRVLQAKEVLSGPKRGG